MRTITTRSLVVSVGMSLGLLYGQAVTIATVNSSYPVTVPSTFTGVMFSTSEIGVSYPVGLMPGSYISGTQLNTDFQTFLSAYPSASDPLEAILGSVLQSILKKYPQMTGGSLYGSIAGPPSTIGGFPIPGPPLGTVSVTIGTYNPATGAFGFNRSGPISLSKPASPAKSSPDR